MHLFINLHFFIHKVFLKNSLKCFGGVLSHGKIHVSVIPYDRFFFPYEGHYKKIIMHSIWGKKNHLYKGMKI
jgi:hypothetical protein